MNNSTFEKENLTKIGERMKSYFAGVIIIALIIISFLGYSFYRNYSINKSFKQIKKGDPESQVVKLLNKPSRVIFSSDKGFWSSNIKGSIKEYHYEAIILPEIWIIGFNSNGIVVYRNHNIM